MFGNMKERKRQREEERKRLLEKERNRLLALSEKELLVEIIMELKNIQEQIDDVDSTIRLYSD